ncbi:50S ribosomal protein L11 methyltransferase [Campylobacter blaseri]|uniref:Ribosomal protein L11 methyltransferase n=1 Tax=Campylobacter blaseri TaxID=2042961 RepID=A0A2P8R1G5_9BACT|nr:50S ribosomal protein L11 methyltransferase [Campylobacter blaseri]PSM52334.1 50S ribosomal protein L11 methyltransferase [Campylobacter blaseri]PSM54100.1 50S ribosomal protein L11 methyltransferase [Campylobacter blaseri]QKF85542.1 50S ribosomal protein L11 methyltransferase [Campylobacter blaseri]
MNDIFFELTIKSNNALELFKDFVFEFGITAIEEKQDSFIVRDSENLDGILYAINEYKKRLEAILGLEIDLKTELIDKKNIDWIKSYQKAVKPIEIDSVYIHPSWESSKEGLINIVIDPALAFGSGHHESTNMCLKLIQNYKNGYNTALDVGCGSGILSICLSKFGFKVDACDTDEQAILATKENAEKNKTSLNRVWTGSIADNDEQYDLVVANIIADVIIMLQKDLIRSVKNEGTLILSGVLEKYLERIKENFKELSLIKIEKKNEWLSFVFKKI